MPNARARQPCSRHRPVVQPRAATGTGGPGSKGRPGGRRKGREAARKGNHAKLREIYSGQLDLPEAIVQAEQLREMAGERPTALLCFEREADGCHRSLLLEYLFPDDERVDLKP